MCNNFTPMCNIFTLMCNIFHSQYFKISPTKTISNIKILTEGVMKLPVLVANRYGTLVVLATCSAYVCRSCKRGSDSRIGQTFPDLASLCSKTCNENANSIKHVKDFFCIFVSKGIRVFLFVCFKLYYPIQAYHQYGVGSSPAL